MGKYLLFAGDKFYPAGGWKDFKGSYSSVADALVAALDFSPEWGQIVAKADGSIVKEWRKDSEKGQESSK